MKHESSKLSRTAVLSLALLCSDLYSMLYCFVGQDSPPRPSLNSWMFHWRLIRNTPHTHTHTHGCGCVFIRSCADCLLDTPHAGFMCDVLKEWHAREQVCFDISVCSFTLFLVLTFRSLSVSLSLSCLSLNERLNSSLLLFALCWRD